MDDYLYLKKKNPVLYFFILFKKFIIFGCVVVAAGILALVIYLEVK
jgi:hypothetical protein